MAAATGASGAKATFREVGLVGASVGTITLKEDRVEWRDISGKQLKEYTKADTTSLAWTQFGQKGHLKLALTEGKSAAFDGFQRDDYEALATFFRQNYSMELEKEKVSCAATP